VTKASIASFVFFTSDSATQYWMQSDAFWNASRAFSVAFFGIVATVWLHVRWGYLQVVVAKRISSKAINTIVKVVNDQSIAAPI
jgi:hypothetical protein